MRLEKRTKETGQRNKATVRDWCVIAAGALIVLGCVGYLLIDFVKQQSMEKVYEDLRTNALYQDGNVESENLEAGTEENRIYCEQVYDFSKLKESNEDIYAWISIPGTTVEYPVLQSETDDYYLKHNLNHSYGNPGAIYTNKCNNTNFNDAITILYGHNMNAPTMFGNLRLYEEKEFFDANREIIIYTEEKRLTYEIYAAVTYNNLYIPSLYDIESSSGVSSFLKDIQTSDLDDVSHVSEGTSISSEDKLIVLSTCKRYNKSQRYLIIGKLIEEAYYK